MHAIFFNEPIESNYIGHQMVEVYRDGVYAPFFNGKSRLTVIDIGANIGVTSYYFSRYAKVVHAIEPSFEHFEVLTHMIEYNKLDNVIPHKLAIWLREKELPLFHNPNRTMFSLHMAVDAKQEAPEKVLAIPLDKFFEDNKIEHCDFMKCDVEGTEFEILASPGFKKVAPLISTIVGEYHEWANRNPNQIRQALEGNGFKFGTIPSDAKLFVGTR